MKKRFHILLIILTIGFFMLPTSSYACGTKSEKSCCKKETSSKTEKKECCKNHSKDKENGCGGKCGNPTCTNSTVNFSIVIFNDFKFNNNNFDFSSEKQNFYYSKTNISTGFYSIWLIPKIG